MKNNGFKMAEMWNGTGEKPIILLITIRIWRWIGHTMNKRDLSIERRALDCNPQGAGRVGPKQTWKRTVSYEE